MLVMVVVFVIVVVVFVFCHGLPMVRFAGRHVERRILPRWLATRSTNAASTHVRKLIEARQYVLNSDWGEVQPRAEDENAYLKRHSWEDYASWFLGLTEGASEDTKGRFAFVFGDFRRVHRSGLIACHYRAAEWRHKEVELAAHDLLQLLDRKSGLIK